MEKIERDFCIQNEGTKKFVIVKAKHFYDAVCKAEKVLKDGSENVYVELPLSPSTDKTK